MSLCSYFAVSSHVLRRAVSIVRESTEDKQQFHLSLVLQTDRTSLRNITALYSIPYCSPILSPDGEREVIDLHHAVPTLQILFRNGVII